jgi:hypothetical protein
MKYTKKILSLVAFASFGLSAGSASAANMLTNGGFETGDFTGWSQLGGSHATNVISDTDPLDGIYSLIQSRKSNKNLFQTFTAITTAATASFDFQVGDPGTARGFNFVLNDSAANNINVRLTDADDGGAGDIQVYDGTAWQTVLNNVYTFDTESTFSLTVNSYGADATYVLSVGGVVSSSLTYLQHGTFNNAAGVAFAQPSLAAGVPLKIDNVLVIPEPGTYALLAGLTGLTFVMLRRRR